MGRGSTPHWGVRWGGGLKEINTYISMREITVAQYIVTRPILDL